MTAGALVILVLVLAAAAFVVAPMLRSDAGAEERRSSAVSEEQDLHSQREMALGALRDLEEDRATGKIGDADYDSFKSRLTAQAVEIMKRIDAIERERSAAATLDRIGPQGVRRSKAP